MLLIPRQHSLYLIPSLFLLIAFAAGQPIAPIELDSTSTTSNGTTVRPNVGWVSSPNGRGTIDILWSCLFTGFLCSWSMLCLNIPSSEDTTIGILYRRFWLTCLCALGPEF